MKYLFLLILLLLLITSCKHTSEPPLKQQKNLRELVWSVDTLNTDNINQLTIFDMWGTSTSDVYAAGHASGGYRVFRYDGVSWKGVNYHAIHGGQIMVSASFTKIFGFDSKKVFIVGSKSISNPNPPPNFIDSSFIMHFDGAAWSEMRLPVGRMLSTLWGGGPNDIWAGGFGPTLFHYNGSIWQNTPLNANISHINDIVGISTKSVFALCYKNDVGTEDTSFHSIHKWNGESWSIVDSFTHVFNQSDYKFGNVKLFAIDGELYSCGAGIFRYNGSAWERMHYRESEIFFLDMDGRERNNLLAVGGSGLAYHFNGSDWFKYEQFQTSGNLWAVWTDGFEVFIAGTDGWRSYIFHGK